MSADASPGLTATDVRVRFRRAGGGWVTAVDGVSARLAPGGVLGVVGESGSGKSTLLRVLAGLQAPHGGGATLEGRPLPGRSRTSRRRFHRAVQVVHQDPYLSLNPRHEVRTVLAQPLAMHRGLRGIEAQAESVRLLSDVGLGEETLSRTPDAFSGGQRQRIVLARALSVEPAYLLLDEPLSALDPAAAEGVLDVLLRLRAERGLAYLLVSHDLEPVRRLAQEVLVMAEGRVVEHGHPSDVLKEGRHPRTRELLAAE